MEPSEQVRDPEVGEENEGKIYHTANEVDYF